MLSSWALSPHSTVCQKVSFSCFSFFNPSYPLLNKSHIHCSPIIHFKQSFVNASSLLAFSNCNSIPACCFNCMSMDHFRINCGAAICQVNVATNRIRSRMFKVFTRGYSLKKECPEITEYRHYFPIATYIYFFFKIKCWQKVCEDDFIPCINTMHCWIWSLHWLCTMKLINGNMYAHNRGRKSTLKQASIWISTFYTKHNSNNFLLWRK